MKYYIIAGEASGDLHGSNLMDELLKIDNEADIRFWGGDLMAQKGGQLVKHYKDLAFMGFIKVVLNLRTILKNIAFCKQDIMQFKPDVIIHIDYAGFNLKIAEFGKKHNIRTYYYIAPKIWAWKSSRIKTIKKYVDKAFTILPFETEFYGKFNYDVTYVGNPVNDAIAKRPDKDQSFDEFIALHNLPNKPIIGLIAGSRKQEIKLMLPVMLELSKYYPNYQFIVAGAPGIEPELYMQVIGELNVPVIYKQTYQILSQSKAALVTSGTATLETGLLRIPQIVCYKTNIGDLLYKIGRPLLKIPWISLVNLILNREAVREMIQTTFKKEYLIKELNQILNDASYRESILKSYDELQTLIGNAGASKKAASLIYKSLSE